MEKYRKGEILISEEKLPELISREEESKLNCTAY